MKIWLCLAALPLAGCYTQLYTQGYAERSVYGYPYDRAAPARDTVYADSGDSGYAASPRDSAADSARRPNTVIVNNYYQDSPYYRGYAIGQWDYPYISFGFYSGRYRDYYGPYWWHDPYYHRGWRPRHYETYPGGGSSGPYHSDKRIFAPAPSQPPLHKGRRAEPAQAAPAPKAADPAPSESSRSYDDNSSSGSSGSSSSGSSSSGSSSGSSGSSGDDHPDLHKGRRR